MTDPEGTADSEGIAAHDIPDTKGSSDTRSLMANQSAPDTSGLTDSQSTADSRSTTDTQGMSDIQMNTYRSTDFRRELVQDDARLTALAPKLAEATVLGVDLEMAQRAERQPGGIQQWRHVLALIQIASDDTSVVVDPLRCRDLSPLAPVLAGPALKVFLGGGQDAALLDRTGIPARNVVDVGEVALSLFGRREDGMAALAGRIFGLSLDKTIRRADWLARPLNPVLLAYAHRDAELTLRIYQWMWGQYPEVVRFHQRRELDPPLPPGAPPWLVESVRRSSPDSRFIVGSYGLDPERDEPELTAAVRVALAGATSPRQINRLVRTASDLGLTALLPEIAALATSPASMLRSSAARAIGQLAEPEEAEAMLGPLREDPMEEVRRAAESATRQVHRPRGEQTAEETPDDMPTLGEGALAALQQLRERLGAGE